MIPKPTASLVINYFYLWKREEKTGQDNGTKDRPCLVLSAELSGSAMNVIVAPITTIKSDLSEAVEIPQAVIKHLGLKEEKPSYIVCTEVNTFVWPGFDISPVGDKGQFVFGFLPPKLFEQVKEKIAGYDKQKKLKVVSRND